ncbi:50S ribosomal protein L29 [Putridiphycobacter roseus]|uniref:Large ribosomal subunit protein uL29 n=1 Tax=Putridiphycobacter roseus TaxID=2219161 RepID=A0A2W1NFW8_9FLAO|nr:50S ribosomal protein L29 [Putridiphycobacter roseus]PZE18385.1 50S ribosomal protein L29 [Putridiphycobacter roseus]
MASVELKDLSVNDLIERIEELEVKQEKLILSHKVTQLENPLQIRSGRKELARLKTQLRKRELEA